MLGTLKVLVHIVIINSSKKSRNEQNYKNLRGRLQTISGADDVIVTLNVTQKNKFKTNMKKGNYNTWSHDLFKRRGHTTVQNKVLR